LRAVEKQIQANGLFEAASSDRKILEAKKRELEEISFDKNELSEIRGGSSEKEKMLAGADARAGVLVKLVSEREKHCKILGKQLLDLTQASKSAGELQEGISQIQIFQNALVQTQSELRKDLVDSVNEEMQEQFKSVYPYGDFESIRLLASEDDYSLELLKSGEWVGVEALSGGERACAAIALRIAFATVLAPSLKWLVLDEPTHNLDSEAVKLLGRAVHEGIPQAVEQVFVITHEEALKEGATGKVFSVSRDKEGMGYSVVEEVSE
jgi:DNA repair exonuclease SbcCD ATPase subunit